MNINPSAAASVAGIGRAVAKGGTSDDQTIQDRSNQSKELAPGGKSEAVDQVDAGDPTKDRGGDGRQVLDVFEHDENKKETPPEEDPSRSPDPENTGHDGHLDLQA